MESLFLGKASVDDSQVNDNDSSVSTSSISLKSNLKTRPTFNQSLSSNSEVANICQIAAIANSHENEQFFETKIYNQNKHLKHKDSTEDFVQHLAYGVETFRTASICAIEMIREKMSRFRRHAISFKNDQSQHEDITSCEVSHSDQSQRAETLCEKMIENTNINEEIFLNVSFKKKEEHKEDKQTNIYSFADKTLQEKTHLTELVHSDCKISLVNVEESQKKNVFLNAKNSPSNQASKISLETAGVENDTNITGSSNRCISKSSDSVDEAAIENKCDKILPDPIKPKVDDVADKLFEQSNKFNKTECNNSTSRENVLKLDSSQNDLSRNEVNLEGCNRSNSRDVSVNKNILHNASKQNSDKDILTTKQVIKEYDATDRQSINLRTAKKISEKNVIEDQWNIIENESLGSQIGVNTDGVSEACLPSPSSPKRTISEGKSPLNCDDGIDNEGAFIIRS